MAVKLRLKRMGAKKRPFYRIVAADSRSPRDGRFIEIVGTYNPILKENNITLDEEKITKWINNGAQPTDTVRNILSKNGIWSKIKNVKKAPKKTKKEVKAPVKKETKTTKAKTSTKKEGK